MKSVTYRHNWDSNTSQNEEMEEKFGKLLFESDTSESYDVESSHLFYDEKTDEYTWIDANACSCWEGDYDGWTLEKAKLKTLAEKSASTRDYRESANFLVAKYIKENI